MVSKLHSSFLDHNNYPDIGSRRDRALEHFQVPAFVGTKTCFDLNGFFGSQVTYDETSSQKRMIGLSNLPLLFCSFVLLPS